MLHRNGFKPHACSINPVIRTTLSMLMLAAIKNSIREMQNESMIGNSAFIKIR